MNYIKHNFNFYLFSIVLLLCLLLPNLKSSAGQTQNDRYIESKINFDLSKISADGLIGEGDGLRSLSYEFCVPKNPLYLAEIKKIDSQISFFASRGRIGCSEDRYLAIGDTHKPNWLEILKKLANLDYIDRIDRFFGE